MYSNKVFCPHEKETYTNNDINDNTTWLTLVQNYQFIARRAQLTLFERFRVVFKIKYHRSQGLKVIKGVEHEKEKLPSSSPLPQLYPIILEKNF